MKTSLSYIKELPEYKNVQPFELFGFPDKDSDMQSNCEFQIVSDVPVDDARPRIDEFSLQDHGFKFINHRSACDLDSSHFEMAKSGDQVVLAYLKETMNLVKHELGAKHIVCFDWRFRRNSPDSNQQRLQLKHVRNQALAVSDTLHCDFSYEGGMDRLHMHVIDGELEKKLIICGAWRPLHTVQNAPLLFADRRTVLKNDLIEVDKVMYDKVEKGFFLHHRPYHHWYYLSEHRPDEMTLFVSWKADSGNEYSDYPPHGAANQPVGKTKPRESVEVRMMAFMGTSHRAA